MAADGETVRGNGLLADSNLTLFLSNGQEPTEGEKLLIDEFRKKLLVEGISNIGKAILFRYLSILWV